MVFFNGDHDSKAAATPAGKTIGTDYCEQEPGALSPCSQKIVCTKDGFLGGFGLYLVLGFLLVLVCVTMAEAWHCLWLLETVASTGISRVRLCSC